MDMVSPSYMVFAILALPSVVYTRYMLGDGPRLADSTAVLQVVLPRNRRPWYIRYMYELYIEAMEGRVARGGRSMEQQTAIGYRETTKEGMKPIGADSMVT
jgi:hypothetical protein